jgi:molecular chaperone GrpE
MSRDDPFAEPGPIDPTQRAGGSVAPAEGPDPAAGDEAAPEEELARLTAERQEYLEALQRLQAEFENYRKRTIRQQTDVLSRASEGVVTRLFPVLDALDLALTHVGEEEATASHLKDALGQINALLRDTLNQEGLERIDACGVPFDPTIHDAVAHVPVGEETAPDDGTGAPPDGGGPQVVEVMRAGYRLKGRVLRPAMVKVRG